MRETDVRPADPAEALTARRILDAAVLEVDGLTARLEAGDILVASEGERDRIRGVLVLEPLPDGTGTRLEAIAVRRRHRARGIGTALVDVALAREGRLTAEFDASVRPFYDALGFECERLESGRYRGWLERD
ncbi:GNAT family N-acetyltransferase [Natronobiforma cellulositropha]|uniref:GNAT family N-acetyltransferase n=1 Tax=Natronobiforma cellulositropha TaxID=1679076 RepID=UPI0021D5C533|nr:GNAT family N-acetyltransferase [Natronobiforma cellulositropha]